MNKKGDINFKDVFTLFILYTLMFTIVSSSANISFIPNNSTGEDLAKNITAPSSIIQEENSSKIVKQSQKNKTSGINTTILIQNQTLENITLIQNQSEINTTIIPQFNQSNESTQLNQSLPKENIFENKTKKTINQKEENFQIEIIQGFAKIEENVSWKKRIYNAPLEVEINLPNGAKEISRKLVGQNSTLKSKSFGIQSIPGKESIEPYVEIEYETLPPEKQEKEITNGKEVLIYSKESYKNVFAYTNLDESLNIRYKKQVVINWIEENEQIRVKNILDTNNNGIYDYVSWTVPHLSNQTFQIIVINVAEHLDSSKNFISDIYPEVKDLDGVYSQTISDNEFVRITFEKKLDNTKDITVYPKIISGTPIIEVYEKNSSLKISQFDPIVNNSKNKIFLTNLIGSQDTFDLKVINGQIQFDYIVDPVYGTYTFNSQTSGDELDWTFTGPAGLNLNPRGTNGQWSWSNISTPSTDVGPDYGQGGVGDGFIYTEMTSQSSGLVWTMQSNNILNADSDAWTIEYYWAMRGDVESIIELQTNENGAGWVTRNISGFNQGGTITALGGATVWNYESIDLRGLISDSSTELRFFVTAITNPTTNFWHSDIGFDTITITGVPLNKSASVPTSLTCNGATCDIFIDSSVELNCSGSLDPEGDAITYMINDTLGYIGNHTQGSSFLWDTSSVSEVSGINFTCEAYDFGGSNKSLGNYLVQSSMVIDHTNPIINFETGMVASGSTINANSIFVNTSIIESNFKNITFNLYSLAGIISSDTFTDATRTITWTELSDKIYFYNVTVYDKAGHVNYTTTRNITLDKISPTGSTSTPSHNSNSNSNQQNLTADISDAIGLKQAILNIFNSTGDLINQTTIPINGLTATIGIIYNFATDGVYNWFYRIFDLANNYYDTSNSTITIDTTSATIILESMINNSGDMDGNLNFQYNITDALSNIDNCSLILNENIVSTDYAPVKNIIQSFNYNGLTPSRYNFSIACFDEANNQGQSVLRYFDVLDIDNFAGETTDLTGINLSSVPNFILENPQFGKISYNENLDLVNIIDINSVVQISDELVSVDSISASKLNKSATIEMYNLNYEFTPIIIKSETDCKNCQLNYYSGGNLSFNVTSFSAYTLKNNSQLLIFDETDYVEKHQQDDIIFYANYTNYTSGQVINSATCNISLSGTDFVMTYNSSSLLYEYNASFSAYGSYPYDIKCFGSSQGFENLSATDYYTVNLPSSNSYSGYRAQSGVYNFLGTDEFIPLDLMVSNLSHAFVVAPNLMNQENVTAGSTGDPAINDDGAFATMYLYNTTHIRVQRNSSVDGPIVVTWQVLEAMNEEFNVQRGELTQTVTTTSVSDIIPINVTAANSMSWFYIRTNYVARNGDKIQFYSNVPNSNTITFTREDALSVNVVFRWIVVEWNTSKIDNFAKGYTGAITGPDTSPDCFNIGTTINKSSSILFHQNHAISDSDGGLDSSSRAGYIQDNSNVCFYDFDGIYTAGVKWFLIDFGNTTKREENIHVDWPTTDYFDDIVFSGSYEKNKTISFVTGTSNGDGTAKPRHTQWSYLTGGDISTGLRIERTYGGQNREYAWQVLELPYYENLDSPIFSNPAVNSTLEKGGNTIKFNLTVTDATNNISWTKGIIGGVERSFTQGIGNEWYYDYICLADETISLSYVFAADDGELINKNSTEITKINATCDSTSPAIFFVSPNTPENATKSSKSFFDIDVSLTEVNFKNITYELYNSTRLVNKTTFSSLVTKIRFDNLQSETYYYNVTATDLVGNIGSTQTRQIIIDKDAPQISYGSGVYSPDELVSADNIFVNVTILEPNFQNVTFYIYDEFMTQVRTPVTFTGGQRSLTWTLLSDGIYNYKVESYDSFGNFNQTEIRTVTLDTSLPIVTFTNNTKVDDYYYDRDFIFVQVAITEAHFKNVTFELYNSTSLISKNSYNDSTVSITWDFLSDGIYYYNVSSYDQANNFGYTQTRKITLDSVNPIVNFGLNTESNLVVLNQNYIFINSSITEINFKNITFELYNSLDTLIDSITFTDSTRDYTFNSLSSALYKYKIVVVDLAENTAETISQTITLDTNPPIVDIQNPKPIAYGVATGLALNFTSSDEFSSLDKCWWNLDGVANNSITCGTSTTFDTTNGGHTLTVYSNDTFGHLGYDSVDFLISTGGPAIVLNNPADKTFYSVSTNTLFNYSATDIQLVDTCSLFGTWNGGWHKNQTDSDWLFARDANMSEDYESYSDFDQILTASNFSNTPNDGCDWQTDSGGTASGTTGPSVDHTLGTALGEYLYIEASANGAHAGITEYCETSGDTAYLETLDLNADANTYNNFSFWYHSYGANTGTLAVDIYDNSWTNLWSITGVNVDAWSYISFNLSSYTGMIKLRISASNGGGYASDIAIDDILLNYTQKYNNPYGNFTVNLTEEGNYEWNIECNDTLGLKETALSNFSVSVDLTAPIVSFGTGTLANNSRVSNNFIYINTSITENNLENITFYLYDDAGVVDDITYSNGISNHTFVGLSDKIYYYNFTATDKASRSTSSLTRIIELDTVPPTGNLIFPTNNYFTKDKTFNFTATVSDLVGLASARLFIKNSTGGVVYTSLISLAGLTSVTIGIIYTFVYDDVFDWFYQIIDSVGNEYNTTSYEIEIDSTAPIIDFIAPTKNDGVIVFQDWININTSVYEKNYKNITFKLYDSFGQKYSNGFSTDIREVNWTLLPDDIYFYNVSSFDLAGNEGHSQTRQIILDTTNPTVLFSGATMPDDAFVSSNSISIDVSVTEANEKNITFYRYGESSFVSSFVDGRRSITWNLLSEGVYYYNVTVFDKVDLSGSSSTRKITLDTTSPIVNFGTGTQNNNINKSRNWIFVNASIVETNFDNITIRLYNTTGLVTTWQSSVSTYYNFTNLDDEEYYYNFTVYDKANNNASSSTRKITLDTIIPVVNFTAPTEDDLVIRNRDWIFMNTTVSEIYFQKIIFNLYDGLGDIARSFELTNDTRYYNFTNLLDDNYKYNVSVIDWAGNIGTTETRNIGLDAAGPTVIITKPKSKTYGSNISLSLEHTATDKVAGLDTCWWNLDGGVNTTVICNTATTFNTTVAPHILNFYANDTFGNMGSDSVSFFISITGPAIELVNPKNDTFYSSPTNINFSFSAADPDGIDTCSLYSDWSGSWAKNETYSGNWYDVGFKHRKNISISNFGTSTLTDFPAYLNITKSYTDAGDYYDLRFFAGSCASQGAALNYDVEYYDANSATVWVKIPSLPSSGTTICMYYGNDNADETENVSGIWNTDYAIVYHMDNNGQDSTINNRNRVADVGSPANDDSFLGEGILFSNNNAWSMTNIAWWEAGYSTRSHEAVFETSSDISTRQVIFAEGGGTNGIMMYILSGTLYVRWWISTQNHLASYPISANTKYHAVMAYDNPGNYALYLNGNQVDSGATTFPIAAHSGDGGIGYTGTTGKDFQDLQNSVGHYFTGSIYEFRGMDNFQTAEWANQTYQMIFNEADSTIYNSEENFTAFTIPISEEGNYNWNVQCNDTIGFSSFGLDNYTFIIDVTNPVVLFGSATAADALDVGRNWIFIDVNLIENNFKNITFNLYNSSQLVDSYSFSDSTREYNFTNLDSGIYYYNVTVYDRASHVGNSPTRSINLDLSPPTGSLTSPSNNSYVNNLIQNLTATFSDSTGLLNATLFVFNETGFLIYTAYKELQGLSLATIGLVYNFAKEGIYYWFYRAEDTVGNIFDTNNNTLVVHVTPPQIDYSLGVEDSGTIFERENIYVNVTLTDQYFANITFNLYNSISQVFAHSFTDSTRNINWTLLPDDIYFYNVSSFDSAGNYNSTATRNITLDNLDPIIDFSGATLPNGAFSSGDEVSIEITVTEANEENITYNLYNGLGANVRSTTRPPGDRSITWNLLGDGIYYYNVTVYDKVGHFASTTTRSIELDNVNPAISYAFGTEFDDTYFARDWIYFKVDIVENNFKNVSLSLYNSTNLISTENFADTTRSFNWTLLPDGIYYYNATSFDKAGNFNSTITRTITLDNQNPLIDFSTPTASDNFNKTSDWIFINLSVMENTFQNITFNLYDVSGVINSTTYFSPIYNINFTSLDSKVYYYNATMFDKAGNSNSTATRKIGIDYLGPAISLINPKAKSYGTNISLPLDYNVNDAIVGTDICWYNIDGGGNTTVDCAGSSTFNVTGGINTFTLNFFANDTFGNLGYKNVTFLVSTTGPAIQLITPVDNVFYSSAQEIFFNYTAEDPDLTQSCSLYGSWNGGWHLNQTDSDWIIGETYNNTEDFEGHVTGDTTFNQNWSNVIGDSCSWHADDAGTASAGTGPNIDNTLGNTTGIYVYMETSTSPPAGISDTCGGIGQEAYLESVSLDADKNNYNLSFWYHMYGAAMGSLYVDVYDGSWQNGIWSISGQQQASEIAAYTNAVIDLSDYSGTIKIRLRGVRGSDYTSDIAIDDLKIISTPGGNKPYGNFSVNLSEEGTHKWNVECNDSKSYDTWAVANYSITFDVTDPVVDFGLNTLPNDTNISQNFIYVNSSIIENNYKNITFYLYNETSLVKSQFYNDSTFDHTFSSLDDGIYYYNITVFDGAARSNSTTTRKIMLDTTSPIGNLNTPNNNAIVNNATQNLTATFSDLNGLKEIILYIFNSSGFIYSQITNLGGVLSATVGTLYTFLSDGVYDWFYSVEDIVGNTYNTTNNSIIIDTTLPVINFVPQTLSNNTYVSQDYIYLNTSVVEINFQNITFSLFNGEGIVAPSPNTFTNSKRDINWTNRIDDEYFYNVTVWDTASNTNSSETRIITLDNVAPTISYSSGTAINFANLSQNYIYVNTSLIETNFQNITFNLYNTTGIASSSTFTSKITEITWAGLFDKIYYYNITTCDKASHCNSLPTRQITLDTTLPLVDFAVSTEPDGSILQRDWIYIDSNVFDTNFKNMSYRLYDNNSNLLNKTSFSSIVNSINFTASGENKTYFYDIIVWDYSSNFQTTALRNITLIDTTFPSLVLISPENKTYPYNNGIRLSYNVADAHLDTCWYSLDGSANITLPNCQSISMDFPDETGHTIDLYVNDTMGYMNSSSVTFFLNSSLIETPTYKVLRGSNLFVDGFTPQAIEITDMSKSFILHTTRAGDNGPNTLRVISNFPTSNEITFSNYNSGAGAIVDWSLISGPGIKVQRGSMEFSNEATLSLSISAINLSNSFIVINTNLDSSNSNDNIQGFFTARFVDDSNIIFKRESGLISGELSFQVVSWENITVQNGVIRIEDNNSSSGKISISSVNLNESFIIFSNNLIGENTVESSFVKSNFSNSSNIEFTRRGTSGVVNISYFILSSQLFKSQGGDYDHLVSGSEQLINLQDNLINEKRSFDIHSNDNDGSSTAFANAFVTQGIKNKSVLALQKGPASGVGTTSWFAVEIKDLNNPMVNGTSPADNTNLTSHSVGPFNFDITDESNMTNCSLYGNWNGGWHLNQTIYSVNAEITNSFINVDVGISGFYNWAVECFDIYGNKGISSNYTFSSYLPPSEPTYKNITQSVNDGTGSIFLDWNPSTEVVKYNIYSSDNVTDFIFLNNTIDTNYTDNTFNGSKRRFYKVEAWNPSGANLSSYTFGVHVYELKHNMSAVHTIKDRNWIGFPTNFTYLKNANDTLNEIANVISVSRLVTSNQKIQSCSNFSCPESFACTDTACNFNLTAGVGYEVSLNVSESAAVNWSGVGIVYDPVLIPLVYDESAVRYNKNWISMTAGTMMGTTVDLAESILGEDAITRWDSYAQISEGLIPNPFPWIPVKYLGGADINMEEGLEISVTQNSAWTQQ